MMTPDSFKRLLLDALADGDDYDGFRTRLRAKLKEAEAEDDAPQDVRARLRESMQNLAPFDFSRFGTA